MNTLDIQDLRDAGLRWLRRHHGSLSRDEHEDIVQDALIELVRAKPVAPKALLGTIIDRRAANLIRAKTKRRRVEIPGGDTTDLSILSDNHGFTIEGAIFATDFDRALRGLPEDERAAFILYELRGLTNYETALHLGVLPSTVASRVDRAKTLLRKEL